MFKQPTNTKYTFNILKNGIMRRNHEVIIKKLLKKKI